jgi:hypothetical protein
MASLVELPGEANPLTRQNVFNALVAASSNTQAQVQFGGQQLQNWEKKENYYPLLQVIWILSLLSLARYSPALSDIYIPRVQDIFVDYSLPDEVRYLAIIQLKNGVDRYWRKKANKYDCLRNRLGEWPLANVNGLAVRSNRRRRCKSRQEPWKPGSWNQLPIWHFIMHC